MKANSLKRPNVLISVYTALRSRTFLISLITVLIVFVAFNFIFFYKRISATTPLYFDLSSIPSQIQSLKETLSNTDPSSKAYEDTLSSINYYEAVLAKNGGSYSYNFFLNVTSNFGIFNLLVKGSAFFTSVSYLDCMIPLISLLVSFAFLITMNNLMGREIENGYASFLISNFGKRFYLQQKLYQSLLVFSVLSFLLFIPTICFTYSFYDISTLILFNNESAKWLCLDLSTIQIYYLITFWINTLFSSLFTFMGFIFFKSNKISIFISSIFILIINSCDSLFTQVLTFPQMYMIIYLIVKIILILLSVSSLIYFIINRKKWNFC